MSYTVPAKALRGAVVKKLVKLALIVAAIVVLAKVVAANKAKSQGVTESEARDPSVPAPTDSGGDGEEPDRDDADASKASDEITAPA